MTPLDVMSTHADVAKMSPARGWQSLPHHLEERILGLLSLPELARMSTTCRSFQAALTWLRNKEQEARCGLALQTFGRKRLANMAALIESCVKGTAVDLSLVDLTGNGRRWTGSGYWKYQDPLVHMHGIVACPGATQPALEARVVPVYMQMQGNVPVHMVMCLGPTRSWRDLRICRGVITLPLVDDGDMRRVALLQAVLSGFCGPTFQDVGRDLVVRCEASSPSPTCTESGVQNEVRPLLPLAWHFGLMPDLDRWGRPIQEHTRGRQGVSAAHPGITLSVSHSHHASGFMDLPWDLQGYIFANFLSGADVAHVAMTCTMFWTGIPREWRYP
jgi:hypothetical protein